MNTKENIKKERKFKKWWWKWFKPKGWNIDLIILEITESHPENRVLIGELKRKFLEKYFITNPQIIICKANSTQKQP